LNIDPPLPHSPPFIASKESLHSIITRMGLQPAFADRLNDEGIVSYNDLRRLIRDGWKYLGGNDEDETSWRARLLHTLRDVLARAHAAGSQYEPGHPGEL